MKDANDANCFPEPMKDVVITCPAYFGNKERVQTKQAGSIAGLRVLAILREPPAAAIAYGTKTSERKSILVYDLGGGTFDITLILVNGGSIKVIATGGDHHLGGDDNKMLKYQLLNLAETKKKLLTAKTKVNVNINWEGQSARFEITRELFDALTADKLNETIDATRKILDIAKEKGFEKIDEYILVGGSSRMPQIKERVDAEFGVDAKLTDPDECVAKGAAIYAMNEAYRQAVEDYENGDADELPKKLNCERTNVMNVTSKTYGLGLINNRVGNMIFANTSLPISFTDTFYTTIDNQSGVRLPIWESDFTDKEKDAEVEDKFCRLVTTEPTVLRLTKNWPKETPITVTFNIDNEGMLSVHAQVEKDEIDFELKVTGVKSEEEILEAQRFINKANIE